MQFTGRVIKRIFAQGSKSEREAILLVNKEGEHLLRRRGGNPFYDPALEELVGKTIRAEGDFTGTTMIISDWTEIGDEKEDAHDSKPGSK
jgi:hypothetical protein